MKNQNMKYRIPGKKVTRKQTFQPREDPSAPYADFHLGEIQLSYKPNLDKIKRLSMRSSKDAYNLLKLYWNPDTIFLYEEVKVLYLNARNCLVGMKTIAAGDTTKMTVDVRMILIPALLTAARAIVIVRNDTAGRINLKSHDIKLAKKIDEAAGLLDIFLLDYLIITQGNYLSWRDELGAP